MPDLFTDRLIERAERAVIEAPIEFEQRTTFPSSASSAADKVLASLSEDGCSRTFEQ